ncbi:homeobox protein unc-4-like protein [Dinothrombium tinctorium]|uniref:Homeobox protein unc-4-like protein n=1 Tax=Dinothrombium tinctorium TaxID=1965070 RepID=A0A3S3PJR7_9ACAR|nr:homeobox protein unc-4-like protein [Dinothrombium tinctorium]
MYAWGSCNVWFQNRRAKWRKKENTKKGPGRPAHNAHPQTCSGDPIPPDEIVKRDRDKKEKKLRKQLERQSKRLQQSKLKPGVNTATLTEAIHQTLTELRAINSKKEAKDLVGSETYSLLVDTLNINVTEILSKVVPSVYQYQKHQNQSSDPSTTSSQSKTKYNSFSIENLLSNGNRDGKFLHSQSAGRQGKNDVTQPVGFFVSSSSPYSSEFHDETTNSSAADSYMSSPRPSSPELDVTDHEDIADNDIGPIDVSMPNRKRLQSEDECEDQRMEEQSLSNLMRTRSLSPATSVSSI